VKQGADLEQTDNGGRTALMWAARQGQQECVRLLLARGSRLDVKDKWGRTAIQLAVEKGHREVAEMLRSAGG